MQFTKAIKSLKNVLVSSTVRDFTGGWDVLDDDLNLSSKFAIKLFNMSLTQDNALTVRWGTKLFADLTLYTSSPGASLINMEYYNAALICVMSNGDIIRIFADGTIARIWDTAIAYALTGHPAGWGATTFASFAQFNNKLIIGNGSDKPVIVDTSLNVDYLQDLATNSNLNTPVASYVTVVDRYMVWAGDPVHPNRIHISARDTSGTYYSDPNPNDATFLDVGSILPNSSVISGISAFRGELIVAYPEGILEVTLGQYDDTGAHQPVFSDPVTQYGSISHRCLQLFGDDMLFMDLFGIPTLKHTLLSGILQPSRVSDLIDPAMHAQLTPLSLNSLSERCWSVYNPIEAQFMFFIPNADAYEDTTETTAYVYSYRPALKVNAWARFDGWNFTCGAKSLQGLVFLGDRSGKVWLYGNEQSNPVYSDFVDDPSINDGNGVPIDFDWELPWSDMGKRTRVKTNKYITLDTAGTASFTVSMYCDRQRLNSSLEDTPLLSQDFTGGDIVGFGDGDQPYGGGRVTSYDKEWTWPATFKLMKLRFRGSATGPLKILSISLFFTLGRFTR